MQKRSMNHRDTGVTIPGIDAVVTHPKGNVMKKISIVRVQKLKTTAAAAYPIFVCWPF